MLKTISSIIRAGMTAGTPRPHASGPYDGASTSRRLSSWTATNQAINSLLFANGDILRARSRDAVRQNPWASNGLEKWVANAVGTGIQPRSKHKDPEAKKAIQEAWLRWTDEADADGLTDFYGIQALVYRQMVEAGECFIRIRYRRPEDNLSVPMQLQLIESEQVPYFATVTPANPNNTIRAGIEFGPTGKRVAYWMYRAHPGDMTFFGSDSSNLVRVPAEQVIHVFRPIRGGQLRGEPWLAKILARLHDLGRFEDAALMAQLVATLLTGFIEVDALDEEALDESKRDVADPSAALPTLEPGTMQKLLRGQKAPTFSKPPDMPNYEAFRQSALQGVSAGMGNTYEHVSNDGSKLNFSSIRAMLVEFRMVCEQIQHSVLVFQFCRPIWNAWMDQAVLAGALSLPGYAKSPYPHRIADWRPPKRPWVQPLDDIRAVLLELQAKLTSREAVVAERGEDVEDVDAAIDRDQKREAKLKIDPVYGHSATTTTDTTVQDNPTRGDQQR